MSEENNNQQNVVHHHHHHRHHRRKKHVGRIIAIVIGVIVLGVALAAGYVYRNMRSATTAMYNPVSKTTKSNSGRNLSDLLDQKKPINLLLLGVDTGADGRKTSSYKGLTDLMAFVTINPSSKKTSVITIARDSRVNLPDYPQYSPIKLNSAYSLGGVSETIKTLDKYYSVPIDGYALVNWGSTMKIITKMGGVDVTSPLTFNNMGYSFEKGKTYHLSGQKALAFVQLRHGDPRQDYGRQERERLVLMAALKKSMSYQTILNSKFMNSLGNSVQTDVTMGEMVDIALNYRKATDNVVSDYAQGTSSEIDNQKYGDMEVEIMSTKERQRISNKIRNELGLKNVTVYKEN